MSLMHHNKEHDPEWHDEDIVKHGGYVYAVSEKFSSVHANGRISQAIQGAFDYKGKKVIDVGCGDGKYSYEIWEKCKPAELIAVDPAKEAVKLAEEKYGQHGLKFFDHSIYDLPFPNGYFDIAVVRGVIHHLDDPLRGIKEAVRVSKRIVLTDPNGYNPGVKIIEKISPYHRQHKEMSYFPHQYRRWLREAGAEIVEDKFILLVPMFFPTGPAKFLAKLEPFFEKSKILSTFFCGTHVRAARNLKYR
jgi:ubiquinone/menaquinone biosynthesis C-methylase UbiE